MKFFYSYAHEDANLLGEMQKHLTILREQLNIEDWYDGEITPGNEWDAEIKKELKEADIILLLISSDSIASEYISKVEVTEAMKRHKEGNAKVIPIILRPCDWKHSALRYLEVLPSEGEPIKSKKWESEDEACLDVVAGIRRACKEVLEQQSNKLEEQLKKLNGSNSSQKNETSQLKTTSTSSISSININNFRILIKSISTKYSSMQGWKELHKNWQKLVNNLSEIQNGIEDKYARAEPSEVLCYIERTWGEFPGGQKLRDQIKELLQFNTISTSIIKEIKDNEWHTKIEIQQGRIEDAIKKITETTSFTGEMGHMRKLSCYEDYIKELDKVLGINKKAKSVKIKDLIGLFKDLLNQINTFLTIIDDRLQTNIQDFEVNLRDLEKLVKHK